MTNNTNAAVKFDSALLVQSAPSAPRQAGDGLTDAQIVKLRRETDQGAHAPRASDLAFARAIIARALAAPRQPGEMGAAVLGESVPKPDMFWQEDEPEEGAFGNTPEDFADTFASGQMCKGDESEVNVLCATRAHTRRMLIKMVSTGDDDARLHWEWLDAPLPAASVQLDEREAVKLTKREAVEKVQAFCNRIPGSTQWNAAEFMFDLLTKGSIE